ncbi:RNA polymerase sigma factor [Marixanthomonas sp. SCSIO 43207]|uniref:RNA polymerase sigma factor n=1 Tax=Marixanthomonas sp. SCSIO 43207 TaxID=2779360 RepID=UPI001CA9723A|nr:RNA polymerase sigma factor [Marixanthomonas sp. SCSIO 43207]UAB82396.1 RNA polymerase sigma factor [Marixanthomonas sp. SCSIO 43207]
MATENPNKKKDDTQNSLIPDIVVVKRVLEGQTDMFEILMRRHNELLYRTIRSYINIEADVEDTLQDTYVKAFQKLYQFKNEALFSTWLIRIGINEALQRKRKSKKHETVDITTENGTLQIADLSFMNPENKSIYKDSKSFIEKAVDALPHKYKIVYMLKEVEGMEISEISQGLDLTKSNVKVRLHRARNMMKDYILHATDTRDIFEFGNSKCDRVVENVMYRIRDLKVNK